MQNDLKLIKMSEVEVEEIKWLWYPYIPFGKISMIQGDPSNGKTTSVLAIAAAVTKGLPLPESERSNPPANVIFQTAEDGLNDTIKPRLIQVGADCEKVIVIDESNKELTLSDSRIEQAINITGAKMFVIDPFQAYIGANVDMHRANEVRPVMKRIGKVAERTGCAIIFVGHLNKTGLKSQYRGLGSIDIYAAARSVLTVGQIKGKPTMRVFAHGKSNLAPEGVSIAFELDRETGFKWIGSYQITIDELLSSGCRNKKESASDRAEHLLKELLSDNSFPADQIAELAASAHISKRTLDKVKAELHVKSFRIGKEWFWAFNQGCNIAEPIDTAMLQCSLDDSDMP